VRRTENLEFVLVNLFLSTYSCSFALLFRQELSTSTEQRRIQSMFHPALESLHHHVTQKILKCHTLAITPSG
jgi:hypothetical protein